MTRPRRAGGLWQALAGGRSALACAAVCGLLAGCASTATPPAGGASAATPSTSQVSASAAPESGAVNPLVPVTPSAAPTAAPSSGAAAQAVTRSLTGRFSIQYEDRYGKQRNAYGNFLWQEAGAAVSLELRSPLGQTLAIIRSAPDGATLEIPDHAPRSAADVDTLMQQTLGFALPVDGLRYWLQPTPEPGRPADTVLDPQNGSRIQEIRQDGWTIDYVAYADAPATGPKRIDLARPAPPLAIKLVLDQ